MVVAEIGSLGREVHEPDAPGPGIERASVRMSYVPITERAACRITFQAAVGLRMAADDEARAHALNQGVERSVWTSRR